MPDPTSASELATEIRDLIHTSPIDHRSLVLAIRSRCEEIAGEFVKNPAPKPRPAPDPEPAPTPRRRRRTVRDGEIG